MRGGSTVAVSASLSVLYNPGRVRWISAALAYPAKRATIALYIPHKGSVQMETTVYLLGAGASKEALPMAGDFEPRLRRFRDKYSTVGDGAAQASLSATEYGEYLRNKADFYKALEWAADIARDYGTLDTFAHECYYHPNDPDSRKNVRRIKTFIFAYFVAEQSLTPIDPRYRVFFNEIIPLEDSAYKIPEHIKIVTWNYDTQLEAAYFGICRNDRLVVGNITGVNKQVIRINGYIAGAINRGFDDTFMAHWKHRGEAVLPFSL